MKLVVRYAILVVILSGCSLARPLPAANPTPFVTPESTSNVTPGSLASPTAQVEPPAGAATPTPECETHSGTMGIEISGGEIRVGETLTITGTLVNQGCAMLGLPLYSLRQEPAGGTIFEPVEVEPVLHSLGLNEGDQDQVQFILTARQPGTTRLSLSASVEVHLGYPGPAYWASVSSPAVEVLTLP